MWWKEGKQSTRTCRAGAAHPPVPLGQSRPARQGMRQFTTLRAATSIVAHGPLCQGPPQTCPTLSCAWVCVEDRRTEGKPAQCVADQTFPAVPCPAALVCVATNAFHRGYQMSSGCACTRDLHLQLAVAPAMTVSWVKTANHVSASWLGEGMAT
jgi:hypothetical protein